MMKLLVCFLTFSSISALAQKVEIKQDSTSRYHSQKESQNAYAMRGIRRVGVGINAAGETGLLGVNIDLNFSREWSFSTGFGGSGKFNTYNMGVKKFFSGTNFLPYVGLGLSRWTGKSDGSIDSTNPGFLADSFMSNSDRENGRINELLIVSKLGIQYMTLSGPYAGYAYSFDVQLLMDPVDLEFVPTGSLGMIYYF